MSGSGGGGGYEYQAQATAYIAAHILTQQALRWIEHSTADVPVAVAAETDGPGDDINIQLQDGTIIELQAKYRLKKNEKFWEAIIKLTRGLANNPLLYCILLTDSTASSTIRDDLSQDIERLGQGRTDSLKDIADEFISKLKKENIPHDSEIFKRLRIVIADLYNSQRDAKTAQVLLSQIIENKLQDENAWNILVAKSLNLISKKGRHDAKSLSHLLSRQNIQLRSTGANPTALFVRYIARLEESILLSKARCIASWQGTGIKEDEAIDLADDMSIGLPPNELKLLPGKLIILTGEMGIGKSLIGERLFQIAIQEAKENVNAPFPIFFEAEQLQGNLLKKVIEEDTRDLYSPANEPIIVIIDKVDDIGITNAVKLLKEARIIIQVWKKVTIVLISRPIPEFVNAPESITVSLLSKQEAEALIKRLSGQQYFSYQSLSESVQDAVLRPLFAVLLSSYLRDSAISIPQSKEQLLSSLVERSLRPLREHVLKASKFLEQLAAACIDRGSTIVPSHEITSWSERQQLLDSRLIVENADSLRFPLPILAQWFAAQSLLSDISIIEKIATDRQRLEFWQYPIVIAVATFPSHRVSELLTPIVKNQPAIAANIVSEALAFHGRANKISSPSALELGQQVRDAMEAWITGFKPFSSPISFLQENGKLPALGVRLSQRLLGQFSTSWVEVAWHSGNENLPDVVELPQGTEDYDYLFSLGWKTLQGFLPYSHVSWAWKWTLEQVISSLLNDRSLPVETGCLSLEAAWFSALYITNRHPKNYPNYSYPIPLSQLETVLIKIGDLQFPPVFQHCLTQLKIEMKAARIRKQTDLSLPTSFIVFRHNHSISNEILRKYVEDVYLGAFEGYQQLVNALYPKFLPKLPLASILPARLVGVIVPPTSSSNSVTWSWYWESLPEDSSSEVKFELRDYPLSEQEPNVQSALEKIQSLYPQWRQRFSVKPQSISSSTSPISNILGSYPVTRLAYQWLWEDLKQVGWIPHNCNFDSNNPHPWLPMENSYRSGMD